MASYFGLYYPYIEFKDEAWLKLAALYWDGLYRMVPNAVIPSDTAEVEKLIGAKFIVSAHPGKAAHRIAEPFCALIAHRGANLRRSFGVAKTTSWDALDHIHTEKIGQPVIDALVKAKLARTQNQWLGLHPRVAHVYMTALAEAMAPVVGARPITDETAHHTAVSGLTMERLASDLFDDPIEAVGPAELEMSMVSLAISYVRPKDPGDISADDIIAFRKDHAAERRQFQTEVNKLIEQLPHLKNIENRDALRAHLEAEYEANIRPKIARLEEAMKDAGWATANSVAAASFALPQGLAAGLHLLGIGSGGIANALGIALSGWNIWRKHNRASKDALKASPEAYLYRIGRRFTPQSTAKAISTTSRKFLPYV